MRRNGLCVSRMRHKQLCVSLWGESETQPWGRRIRQHHASCGASRYAGGTRGYRSSGHSSRMHERHPVTHRDRCSATGVSRPVRPTVMICTFDPKRSRGSACRDFRRKPL